MAAPALPSLDQLEAAAALVRAAMPPTPQYCWPLLSRRIGAELWVKHENHTPIGAFKLRGGLVYLDELRRAEPGIAGIISATTGNHGQSIAYAATRLGLAATIVVPHGNSPEKNRAMRGFGADLVEHGHDFQAAYEYAAARAAADRLHMLRSFDPLLVRGVASYGLELFRARGPARHGVCADRARQRHLRRDRGTRGAGADRRDRRRRRRKRPDLCAVLRRRARGADQFRRYDGRRVGGARAGRGGARDHPEARGAHRHGVRGRDAGGDARSSLPTRTMSPRAPAPPPSPPRSRSAAGSPASGSRSCCRAAISTARCSPRFSRKPIPRWNRRPRDPIILGMEPAYKLLTVAEFLDSCPNDERHYQLIDGVIVAMAPPAIPHQIIAANLTIEIELLSARTGRTARCAAKPASRRRGCSAATISRPTSR